MASFLKQFQHGRRLRRFGRTLRRFFPHAYCINLDHRTDRWEAFTGEMARLGLDDWVQRFPAVNLKTEKYLPYERLQGGKYSLLSNYGAMMSHRSVVQLARDKGLDYVLTFEDDATLREEAMDALEPALKDLAERPWKGFFLGATHNTPMERATPHLLQMPGGAHGLQAIAFHSRVYGEVLEALPEDPLEAMKTDHFVVDGGDVWLQEKGVLTGEVYCPDDIVFVQRGLASDISSQEGFDVGAFQISHFERFRPKD